MLMLGLGFLGSRASITATLSPSGGSDQASIQAKLDEFAAMGPARTRTLYLTQGTYRVDEIRMPLNAGLTYSNIKVKGLGQGATIAPETNLANKSLWWIGHNFGDWFAPKMSGIGFDNIIFDGEVTNYPLRDKLVRTTGDYGTVFNRCTFKNSRNEGLYIGGGTSSTNGRATHCTALNCGQPQYTSNAQNLSAYNVNGLGWEVSDSSATDCGWAAEGGGTSCCFRRCAFTNSPLVLGSTVYGCCDIEISDSTLVNSYVQWGNGIGKICDIRVLRNSFSECGVSPEGGKNINSVDPALIGGLPWTGLRSRVEGNVFSLQSANAQLVRMTQWSSQQFPYGVGSDFTGNTFTYAAGKICIVVQGGPTEEHVFSGNTFNGAQQAGIAYTHPPIAGYEFPNQLGNIVFDGTNAAPAGSHIVVSPQNIPGWPNLLEVH